MKKIYQSIEIWSLDISASSRLFQECRSILSASEQQRAANYLKEEDHDRFTLGRGALRQILGDQLGIPPASVPLKITEHGKPVLPDGTVHFNVSHSRNRILIAVYRSGPVGVDIEYRRLSVPMDPIAARWFSPSEQKAFRSAPRPETVFYDIWSRKEAYIKALGKGIFHELSSFSVPLENSTGSDGPDAVDGWGFQSLEIDPDYSAALVYQMGLDDSSPPEVHIYENLLRHGRA